MNPERQAKLWLLIFALFGGLLWLLKPVLLPFVAGLVLAYFFAPVVNALEARKVPRWIGALAVMFGFLIIVALLVVLILPMISSQIGALINAVPGYIEKFRNAYLPWIEDWLTRFRPEDVEKLRDAAGQSAGEAAGLVSRLVRDIVSGSFAVIDGVALAIITPVTAFFTLRDWPRLVGIIDSLLPRRHYATIREQLDEIDKTLSGFIRGQALVCLALGTIYSTGLALTGLKYSAAIGVTAGVLSFIPYVGSLFGWISSLILALVQFQGDWAHIGSVVAVFLGGHFLEAYVLTPKLVGHRVGLPPIWILFALITGAKLMGFTGVLIAVPSAAVLGVLARFFARRYRASALYQ